MEAYSEAWAIVVEHVGAHQTVYTVVGVLFVALLPLIYLTRRWTGPIILYTVETICYLYGMHVGVGVVTRAAAWFKESSSMDRAFSREKEAVEWTTPWLRFWEQEAYFPPNIFWIEVVFAVLIIFAVWRYRPLRVRRKARGVGGKKPALKGGQSISISSSVRR